MYLYFDFSVMHPFKGDYVRLRQNVKWNKMATETNDSHVVFADIVMKINRKNGKVGMSLYLGAGHWKCIENGFENETITREPSHQ